MHDPLAGREGIDLVIDGAAVALVAQHLLEPERVPEAAIVEVDVADGERVKQ